MYQKHEMEILAFELQDAFCDLETSGDHGVVTSIGGDGSSADK